MGRQQSNTTIDSISSAIIVDPIAQNKTKSAKRKNTFDNLSLLIVCTLIAGLGALGLEAVAYQLDDEWDLILNADLVFPDVELTEPKMFNHNLMFFNITNNKLESVKKLLLRTGPREGVAICFIGGFIILVFLSLLLYFQREGSQKFLSFIHALGAFFMFVSAILIIVSDLTVDQSHIHAVRELEDYYKYLQSNPPKNIPLESLEVIKRQTINLIAIEKLCALSTSKGGRYSGSYGAYYIWLQTDESTIKRITLPELNKLRFCSYADLKFGSFILCLVYAILCFGVPSFICYQDRKNQSKVQGGGMLMSSVPPSMVGFTPQKSVPPAYGYGYPEPASGSTSQPVYVPPPYDPRYAPIAPEDLGLITTPTYPKKSNDSGKESYQRFHEKSFDSATSAVVSYDSFAEGLFSSFGSLNDKDAKKFDETNWSGSDISVPKLSTGKAGKQASVNSVRTKKIQSLERRLGVLTEKVDHIGEDKSVGKAKKTSVPKAKKLMDTVFEERSVPEIEPDDFEPVKRKEHATIDPHLPDVPKEQRRSKQGPYQYESPYIAKRKEMLKDDD